MNLFTKTSYRFEVIASDNVPIQSISRPDQLINYVLEVNQVLKDACENGWVYIEKIKHRHTKEQVLYAEKVVLPMEEDSHFFDEKLYPFYTKKYVPHQTLLLDDLEDEHAPTEQRSIAMKQPTEREEATTVSELLALVKAQQEQLEQVTKQMNRLSREKEIRYVPISQVPSSDDPFIHTVVETFLTSMGELSKENMDTFKEKLETINIQEVIQTLVNEQLEREKITTLDSEKEKIEKQKQMKIEEENIRHKQTLEEINCLFEEEMKKSQELILQYHEKNNEKYLYTKFPEIQSLVQYHYQELCASLAQLRLQLYVQPDMDGKNTS